MHILFTFSHFFLLIRHVSSYRPGLVTFRSARAIHIDTRPVRDILYRIHECCRYKVNMCRWTPIAAHPPVPAARRAKDARTGGGHRK